MFSGGFFSKEEVGAGAALPKLTGCAACGLAKQCHTPKMKASGKGERKILIVSEIPCESEDSSGRMFAGEATKYLKKIFSDHGIDMEKDCRKIAAVSCRPPEGRSPSLAEVEMCRPRVMKEIAEYAPHLILVLGNAAVTSVIGSQWMKDLGNISKWRGWTIPDRFFKGWVCPTFHPSYVLKSNEYKSRMYNPVVDVIFNNDIKRALSLVEAPLPVCMREEAFVRIVENPRDLVKELEGILEWERVISLDFETTGLKPDAPVHEIVTCSISTSGMDATSFNFPQEGPAKRRLKEIFARTNIKKYAHNAKFEERWAKAFDVPLFGTEWDSMLAAHVLDNRDGIASLKFQSYVNFGISDYDSHLSPFLKSTGDTAYALNRVREAPRKELLLYNGIDSMLTFRLTELQKKCMGGKQR